MKQVFSIIIICFFNIFLLQAQIDNLHLQQFSFEDTAGNIFNLEKLKGKTVFVDCWFPNCPPCRKEMPYTQLLQQRLHTLQFDSNIVFVTICFRQSREEWLKALQEIKLPNAIHLYAPASIYETTLTNGIYPTYRIFNNEGVLENENAIRPSEFAKADFILYAATNNMPLKTAKKLFEDEGRNILNNVKKTSSNKLLNNFFEKFMPYKEKFLQAFLLVEH
ncbi:MAG: TlpA family protein disulfide reductase [Chitinophagaceae bacterium]|nr:TlpA family protein disulfide reductase [Chitinophagaceae bacterium]